MDAFAELERAVVEIAPAFIALENAPDTWERLQRWSHHKNALVSADIPVWNGACHNTIYSKPYANYAFRAWHDSLHLLLHRSFSFEDELAVAREHYYTAYRLGLSNLAQAALYFDTAGQSNYERTHGEFPTNQRTFVVACMDRLPDPKYTWGVFTLDTIIANVIESGTTY